MKKTVYLTFRFRSLIVCSLAFLLGFSSVLLIFSGNKIYAAKDLCAVGDFDISSDSFTVIIDAGHGGEDGGTQSSDGTLEKDINLQISLKLEKLLQLMGYNTVMIRSEDKLIYSGNPDTTRARKVSDLNNRLEIAKAYPDAVFISVHQNYFTESKYSGAQVFYSPNNEKSKLLAEKIQCSITGLIQPENGRKIKKSGSDIFLLDRIEIPAVMVECGFMSNPSEALLLKDEAYQKKIALSIANGINEYLLLLQEEK